MSGLSVRPAELLTPWLDTALPWQQGVFERLTSLERQEKLPHAVLLWPHYLQRVYFAKPRMPSPVEVVRPVSWLGEGRMAIFVG